MTTLTAQVTPGVWVARGERDQWIPADPHPHDRTTAATLPRWRATEFLASRALLRHLLRAVLPEQADAPVHADGHGRPALSGHPGTGISISHDGDAIAVAVAPHRRVGVDVQQPADSAPDTLLRRCLGRHTEAVSTLPERQRAVELAWVWTVQEACVKAAGTGLSGRPWEIDVTPGRPRGQWDTYEWISLRERSRTPLSCAFSAPRSPVPRGSAPRGSVPRSSAPRSSVPRGDVETLCS
ncbi:4'-phosphopantetheinyl transferase superfamily protein [Streptomyces roseoverticillatus]|uniref:4'-phosphopantetheinyl transferase family protein n=1 Tax=Streptomyces roseoverticillatus TaxID=66429 RepID=UPI001F1EFD3A|nr:4'-phosphopantetheinyl transferase superfamily protein [Streptomyces roseoverticillatus]MCF3103096.1 4'-phosphopantetheinyl transferase superfamily protein [Streptomyces roseoverticillatus]